MNILTSLYRLTYIPPKRFEKSYDPEGVDKVTSQVRPETLVQSETESGNC